MNLNVHFHVAVPDGVFTSVKGAARADFWRLPTPDRLDVETLTVNVEMRVETWLRRHVSGSANVHQGMVSRLSLRPSRTHLA